MSHQQHGSPGPNEEEKSEVTSMDASDEDVATELPRFETRSSASPRSSSSGRLERQSNVPENRTILLPIDADTSSSSEPSLWGASDDEGEETSDSTTVVEKNDAKKHQSLFVKNNASKHAATRRQGLWTQR